MPFLSRPPPYRVGERKGIRPIVKIQELEYTLGNSAEANVPTPWITFLCQCFFQGRYMYLPPGLLTAALEIPWGSRNFNTATVAFQLTRFRRVHVHVIRF